jgi:hypothetical protein
MTDQPEDPRHEMLAPRVHRRPDDSVSLQKEIR